MKLFSLDFSIHISLAPCAPNSFFTCILLRFTLLPQDSSFRSVAHIRSDFSAGSVGRCIFISSNKFHHYLLVLSWHSNFLNCPNENTIHTHYTLVRSVGRSVGICERERTQWTVNYSVRVASYSKWDILRNFCHTFRIETNFSASRRMHLNREMLCNWMRLIRHQSWHILQTANNATDELIQIYVHKLPSIHTFVLKHKHIAKCYYAFWGHLLITSTSIYCLKFTLLVQCWLLLPRFITMELIAQPNCFVPFLFFSLFILFQLECIRTANEKKKRKLQQDEQLLAQCISNCSFCIKNFLPTKRRTQDNCSLLRMDCVCSGIYSKWCDLASHLIGKYIFDAKYEHWTESVGCLASATEIIKPEPLIDLFRPFDWTKNEMMTTFYFRCGFRQEHFCVAVERNETRCNVSEFRLIESIKNRNSSIISARLSLPV